MIAQSPRRAEVLDGSDQNRPWGPKPTISDLDEQHIVVERQDVLAVAYLYCGLYRCVRYPRTISGEQEWWRLAAFLSHFCTEHVCRILQNTCLHRVCVQDSTGHVSPLYTHTELHI